MKLQIFLHHAVHVDDQQSHAGISCTSQFMSTNWLLGKHYSSLTYATSIATQLILYFALSIAEAEAVELLWELKKAIEFGCRNIRFNPFWWWWRFGCEEEVGRADVEAEANCSSPFIKPCCPPPVWLPWKALPPWAPTYEEIAATNADWKLGSEVIAFANVSVSILDDDDDKEEEETVLDLGK